MTIATGTACLIIGGLIANRAMTEQDNILGFGGAFVASIWLAVGVYLIIY